MQNRQAMFVDWQPFSLLVHLVNCSKIISVALQLFGDSSNWAPAICTKPKRIRKDYPRESPPPASDPTD